MLMIRDPKTGRFVKSLTSCGANLPKSYRDPNTGRFVKRPATCDDDSIRKQVSDLQNRLLKLEAQVANCVVPNWEDCIWREYHDKQTYESIPYNPSKSKFDLAALPYPTWLLLDGGITVKLGKQGSDSACLHYMLSQPTSFLPILVPAYYWVSIEMPWCKTSCACRFRCLGYTPEQEQT